MFDTSFINMFDISFVPDIFDEECWANKGEECTRRNLIRDEKREEGKQTVALITTNRGWVKITTNRGNNNKKPLLGDNNNKSSG